MRDFTRSGRKFPLVCRRPKKAVFSYGCAVSGPCPLRDLSPLQGPFRADRLTGRPLTGWLLTGRPLTGRLLTGDTFNYRKDGKLRGGTLPELGGNFRLCAVDQKRPFFLRVGPFLDLLPFKGPFPLTGTLTGRLLMGRKPKIQNPKPKTQNPKPKIQNPKSKTQKPKSKIQNPKGFLSFCRKASQNPKRKIQNPKPKTQNPKSKIQNPKPKTQNPRPSRADRLTGRPLTGRLLTGRPLTGRLLTRDTFNYRKADGKLRGGTVPELGGNFRLCAVDHKRPLFLRVGPFLDLLPFKGPFPLQGPLREGFLWGGNPKSKIQNPKPKIQNPKSKIQNPKSKTQKPKSKIQNPKGFLSFCRKASQNPKRKIQNPKPKIQNPKPKTQNPKS